MPAVMSGNSVPRKGPALKKTTKRATPRKRTSSTKPTEVHNVGVLIKGSEAVPVESVEAIRDALLNIMTAAFDTRIPESVYNNIINAFREATKAPTSGYNQISGCDITMSSSDDDHNQTPSFGDMARKMF